MGPKLFITLSTLVGMVFMLELDMSSETGHLVHGVVTLVTVQLFVFMARLEVPKKGKSFCFIASNERIMSEKRDTK